MSKYKVEVVRSDRTDTFNDVERIEHYDGTLKLTGKNKEYWIPLRYVIYVDAEKVEDENGTV